MRVPLHRLRVRRAMTALALILWTTACAMSRDETSVLTADMPLHLEDHLDAATVTGSALPATVPATVEWQFDRPQSEWHATSLWNPPYGRAPTLTRTADALRVTLTERLTVLPNPGLRGAIHVGVAAWNRAEWADVVIRARADSTSSINFMRLAFNLREGRGTSTPANSPFQFPGQQSPIVRDGNVHTYQLRVNQGSQTFEGPWRELVVVFGSAGEPGSIDVLSVSVIPAAAAYASRLGVRSIDRDETCRRSLFTHAPGRIEYRVLVPEGGRLNADLGVVRADAPVEFRVGRWRTTTTSSGAASPDSKPQASGRIRCSSWQRITASSRPWTTWASPCSIHSRRAGTTCQRLDRFSGRRSVACR